MSLKFGLSLKSKASAPGSAAKVTKKKKALLDDAEEDAEVKPSTAAKVQEIGEFNFDDIAKESDATPAKPASKQKTKPTGPPTKKPLGHDDDIANVAYSASAQEAERRAQEALEIDSTIYDYDAAYDAMHAKTAARKAAERANAEERRPKYMDSLLESAEQRKKDQLRARDKMVQREREAEGDEFADKEKFVTGAYKAQQEEARKLEAEEKKRQEADDEKRRKFGMQGFHKQMLMEEEKRHQEAMEAAAEAARSGVKIELDEEPEKTEAQLARELQAQGKDIILNDEGQVADKRQLLSAGLNIIAKPKKTAAVAPAATRQSGSASNHSGRNANQRDIRARHTQMVAEQIEQAAKRKAEEEAEEQRKLQRASKSQKTESDISSAKERYLQRKREAAAAKAAAGK